PAVILAPHELPARPGNESREPCGPVGGRHRDLHDGRRRRTGPRRVSCRHRRLSVPLLSRRPDSRRQSDPRPATRTARRVLLIRHRPAEDGLAHGPCVRRARRRRRIALGRDAAGLVPPDEGFVHLRSPVRSVLARAGIAAVVLGRVSDRVKVRSPFLLLGPALSIPACLLAFFSRNLESFAFAIGWLSMTSVVAASFLYTILVDHMEESNPAGRTNRP